MVYYDYEFYMPNFDLVFGIPKSITKTRVRYTENYEPPCKTEPFDNLYIVGMSWSDHIDHSMPKMVQ